MLDKKEFVNLMNSLGLGLSNEDIDNLQAKWDIDVDGCVNWKEVSSYTIIQHNNIIIL